MTGNIFYMVPDYNVPSWGNGLLYHHVELLRRSGFNAFIVHNKAPFRMNWMESNVPVMHLDQPDFRPGSDDILVLSELAAADKRLRGYPCRKIVFVQGSFLILSNFDKAFSYRELGFEHAITVMPHIQKVIENHFGLKAAVIPPFIAPYFFIDRDQLNGNTRNKQIALFPKSGYSKAGYLDYDILLKVLKRKLSQYQRGIKLWATQKRHSWRLVEIEGVSHQQVAQIFKESMFFVNVNCLESFNATVPEAMAAGCIPICYESIGGPDFLENKKNAYVFPNNQIYPLLSKLFDLLDCFDSNQDEFSAMRQGAYETACQYTKENTEQKLIRFFESI